MIKGMVYLFKESKIYSLNWIGKFGGPHHCFNIVYNPLCSDGDEELVYNRKLFWVDENTIYFEATQNQIDLLNIYLKF